jgi:hypothetical protein
MSLTTEKPASGAVGTQTAAAPTVPAPHSATSTFEGHPRRWLVLPVILTAMFMAMFDSSASFSTSYQ